MVTHPRRTVLRKIAARRRRSGRPDTRVSWTVFLSGGAAASAASARSHPALLMAPRLLTRRELQVLRLVASGETDRGIADTLYVSRRTISSHVSNILDKLDVPSRRAAVVVAARIGLL